MNFENPKIMRNPDIFGFSKLIQYMIYLFFLQNIGDSVSIGVSVRDRVRVRVRVRVRGWVWVWVS